MIHCQNRVLVLPWLLMGASSLCVKQLAIEMHYLWVYGCWCTEQEGGAWK